MGKDLKGRELGKGISQRKDGRYEARAVINGKKINLYGLKLNELKREFEAEKDKVRKSNITHYSDATLNDWFEEWFEKYKKPTLKTTGVLPYRRKFVNTIGRLLGDKKLTDIEPFHIQTVVKQLVDEQYKTKSIRDAIAVLKLCCDAAIANKMIDFNPCIGCIVPNYDAIKKERVLSIREQEIFLDAVKNNYYEEAYNIMLLTGMRIGELGGLQWEDIDFENGFIQINRALYCQYDKGVKHSGLISPKTANSYRKIPFFGETKSYLLSQKKKQDRLKKELGDRWRCPEEFGNLVFTSSMGSPVTRYVLASDMNNILKNINLSEAYNAQREGRNPILMDSIHPHCLRHTFITRCFEKGMKAHVVQSIAGHANINMTMRYTHTLDDSLQEEANNVGNFFDKSCVNE